MNNDATQMIPSQTGGGSSNTEEQVELTDAAKAKEVFNRAKNKLLHVNDWGSICQGISATFTLTDASGNKLNTIAHEGNYIKIDIPGPGTKTGDGDDWVYIVKIEDGSSPNDMTESFGMQVHPSPAPAGTTSKTAHFFDEKATSNFIIQRKDRMVKAGVYGRNEQPNTNTDKLLDNVRNAITGTLAILGIAKLQWKALVKALLDK